MHQPTQYNKTTNSGISSTMQEYVLGTIILVLTVLYSIYVYVSIHNYLPTTSPMTRSGYVKRQFVAHLAKIKVVNMIITTTMMASVVAHVLDKKTTLSTAFINTLTRDMVPLVKKYYAIWISALLPYLVIATVTVSTEDDDPCSSTKPAWEYIIYHLLFYLVLFF